LWKIVSDLCGGIRYDPPNRPILLAVSDDLEFFADLSSSGD